MTRWWAKYRFRGGRLGRSRTLVVIEPHPDRPGDDVLLVVDRTGSPVLRITADGLIQFLGICQFWDYEQDAFLSTPPDNPFARWEQDS